MIWSDSGFVSSFVPSLSNILWPAHILNNRKLHHFTHNVLFPYNKKPHKDTEKDLFNLGHRLALISGLKGIPR